MSITILHEIHHLPNVILFELGQNVEMAAILHPPRRVRRQRYVVQLLHPASVDHRILLSMDYEHGTLHEREVSNATSIFVITLALS